MNERYLCRGKRKDNGELVEGYLYITHDGKYEIAKYCDETNIERIAYEVIPETVGRCTGLRDKNGKLIFEGDIIKTKEYGRDIGHSNVNNFDIFKVIYEPAVFRLENVRRGFNLVGNGNDFEIIGNIHDAPELLEVER